LRLKAGTQHDFDQTRTVFMGLMAFMGLLTHNKERFKSQLPMMLKASSHNACMQTVKVGA